MALLRCALRWARTSQFLANIWGFYENLMKAAGTAADGVVWPLGAAPWTADVPGMKLVHEYCQKPPIPRPPISRSITSAASARAWYYMKEAMEVGHKWRDHPPNIKQGCTRRLPVLGRSARRLPEGDVDGGGPSRLHPGPRSTRHASRPFTGRRRSCNPDRRWHHRHDANLRGHPAATIRLAGWRRRSSAARQIK